MANASVSPCHGLILTRARPATFLSVASGGKALAQGVQKKNVTGNSDQVVRGQGPGTKNIALLSVWGKAEAHGVPRHTMVLMLSPIH